MSKLWKCELTFFLFTSEFVCRFCFRLLRLFWEDWGFFSLEVSKPSMHCSLEPDKESVSFFFASLILKRVFQIRKFISPINHFHRKIEKFMKNKVSFWFNLFEVQNFLRNCESVFFCFMKQNY